MPSSIHHLVSSYGYFGVGLIIGLESMGIPVPGETVLISGAIYAAATQRMNIYGIVAAAVAGAVMGDNIGYLIGRLVGLPVLERIGPRIGISAGKLKLGRYLFERYGIAVVFFGRFVAILRTLAAFLAGVSQMHWLLFFAANFAGAVLWAGAYGTAAYMLGNEIHRLAGPVAAALFAVAAVAVIVGLVMIRRHQRRLQDIAEAEYPGPVTAPRRQQ